ALFAALFAVWSLRTDEIVDAERDTGNVATIFADQISQAVGAFDAALIEITERLAAIHRMTPEQYPEGIRSENLFHLLVDVASRLPGANVVAILGADGHIVNHSTNWPAPNIDVSDREFFVAQKTGNPGIYVGLTVVSRVNPEPTLFFSRRVQSQEGEFLGVV